MGVAMLKSATNDNKARACTHSNTPCAQVNDKLNSNYAIRIILLLDEIQYDTFIKQMLKRKYVSQPSFSWKGNPTRWCKTPESKQTPWHLLSTSLLVSSGLKTQTILNYKWVLIYGPKFGKPNKKLAKSFKIILCEVKSAKVVPLLQSNLW